jgi:uncharacterized protein YndB with AHSA1/START domain
MTVPVSAATTTTQVFRVHIKATPERIWEAITTPEWTARYGYRTPQQYDLEPGGTFRALANDGMKAVGSPDVVVEGWPFILRPEVAVGDRCGDGRLAWRP